MLPGSESTEHSALEVLHDFQVKHKCIQIYFMFERDPSPDGPALEQRADGTRQCSHFLPGSSRSNFSGNTHRVNVEPQPHNLVFWFNSISLASALTGWDKTPCKQLLCLPCSSLHAVCLQLCQYLPLHGQIVKAIWGRIQLKKGVWKFGEEEVANKEYWLLGSPSPFRVGFQQSLCQHYQAGNLERRRRKWAEME